MKKLYLLSFLLLTSCVSMPHIAFDKIEKGMDRSDVLELVGSPLHVNKQTFTHVWIYRFFDRQRNEIIREVQFESGRVVYSGERITFDKIIFPTASGFTEKDLETYLKQEASKEEGRQEKPFQDSVTMEEEMLKLKKEEGFVPIEANQ